MPVFNMLSQYCTKKIKLFVRYLRTWIDPYFARFKFYFSSNKPEWLSYSALEDLQKKYPQPIWNQYDDANILIRSSKRAAAIQKMLGKQFNRINDILEIGCWDGMVSAGLQKSGKTTTAVDYCSEGFHRNAKEIGVKLLQMDAMQMQLPNDTFDFIFSIDAFEHFANPDKVFLEINRLLRKNGLLYLSFGPIFQSPFGLHADHSVSVPYCQILFERKTMEDFIVNNNLTPIDFGQTNSWTLKMYKTLFKSCLELKILKYYEIHDPQHLKIIAQYPSCFKSKAIDFNEFTVSGIEILLQKV